MKIRLDPRAKDMTNQRFGKLTVVEPTERRISGSVVWKCKCDCGNISFVPRGSLVSGHSRSCGCQKYLDLTGKRFGRLIALEQTDDRKHDAVIWKFQCDCGNIHYAPAYLVKRGNIKSCGCLQDESRKIGYGEAAFNHLYLHYKAHARRRKIAFELTKEQFKKLTSSNCYYCNQEPNHVSINKSNNGDYIYNGIDRIDNDKNYILENCVSCCETCNRAKLQMGINEFLDWICRVYSHSAVLEYT